MAGTDLDPCHTSGPYASLALESLGFYLGLSVINRIYFHSRKCCGWVHELCTVTTFEDHAMKWKVMMGSQDS